MELKLDDLDLIQRSQADSTSPVSELRAVYDIQTLDCRSLVELKIPGSQGGFLQDLGREPVLIRFKGMMSGPDAKTSLEKLQGKFKARTPIPFSTDIVAVGEINKVLIESLWFEGVPGEVDRFTFLITLKEHTEPHEPSEEEAPSQEEAEEAVGKESDINDIRGRFVDETGEPAEGVDVIIRSETGDEYKVTTDDEGYFEKEDLPEGTYAVTCESEGFEDYHVEVKISKKTT